MVKGFLNSLNWPVSSRHESVKEERSATLTSPGKTNRTHGTIHWTDAKEARGSGFLCNQPRPLKVQPCPSSSLQAPAGGQQRPGPFRWDHLFVRPAGPNGGSRQREQGHVPVPGWEGGAEDTRGTRWAELKSTPRSQSSFLSSPRRQWRSLTWMIIQKSINK